MSQQTDELRAVGTRLANDGFNHSAGIVLRAADRMERMEELIIQAKGTFDSIAKTCSSTDET